MLFAVASSFIHSPSPYVLQFFPASYLFFVSRSAAYICCMSTGFPKLDPKNTRSNYNPFSISSRGVMDNNLFHHFYCPIYHGTDARKSIIVRMHSTMLSKRESGSISHMLDTWMRYTTQIHQDTHLDVSWCILVTNTRVASYLTWTDFCKLQSSLR